MAITGVTGSWPDVIAVPTGVAIVRVLNEETVVCTVNDVEVWRRTVVTGARPKWTRIAADPVTGEVRALVSVAIANNRDRAVVVSEASEVDLGINLFGYLPVAMEYAGGDFVAYLVTSKFLYTVYPLAGAPTPTANPFPVVGTISGIRDVVAGVVSWDATTTGEGYGFITIGGHDFYHYRTRGSVTAGQQKGPPATPEGIIASPDGVTVSTVINVRAFYPTLAEISAGPFAGQVVIVARTATTQTPTGSSNVGIFTGSAATFPGYDPTTSTGLLGLSGLYQQPIAQRDNLQVTVPWYRWFTDLVKQAFGPINLGSAQVQGVLEPENGGTGGNDGLAFIIEDLGLITGLTGDVEATGPGVATATLTGNWIPLVDGSEPPVFITDGAGHLVLVWYEHG